MLKKKKPKQIINWCQWFCEREISLSSFSLECVCFSSLSTIHFSRRILYYIEKNFGEWATCEISQGTTFKTSGTAIKFHLRKQRENAPQPSLRDWLCDVVTKKTFLGVTQEDISWFFACKRFLNQQIVREDQVSNPNDFEGYSRCDLQVFSWLNI